MFLNYSEFGPDSEWTPLGCFRHANLTEIFFVTYEREMPMTSLLRYYHENDEISTIPLVIFLLFVVESIYTQGSRSSWYFNESISQRRFDF